MEISNVARRLCLSSLSFGIIVTTGCASIVGGTNQPISVETRSTSGESIAGANCKLENPKGTWYVTTPGSVTVHRAYDDLSIYCTKTGEQPGIASVKSSTKGMAFGNILFGGIIGVGVDTASGAAYDYPTLITVQLGGTTTITPPAKDQTPPPATAQKTAMTPVDPTAAPKTNAAAQ
ncbi:hypothetical protein LJ655_26315 [Paraburkholderia sp. MMS20-SJTN17]|uniref:Lipoprotein n=1 Tax=Paraburkholderia translucens TaxID=2886945 RepID=A0ABS8KKP1_9BURK|nr:hypothetical protein [Paraburkholderia sp. MMS20-SJTN17]MCC8405331.1 hypothetical protein [Paraburkholderia sp. MMS20-SJTN17]